MSQITVSTMEEPAWWSGASTVRVTWATYTWDGSISSVEYLPHGISFGTTFVSWSHLVSIEKLT